MGSTCKCSCNKQNNFDREDSLLGDQIQPFQNYSKPPDELDQYDVFYRVACYPLHCLQCNTFFSELDKLNEDVQPQEKDQNEVTPKFEVNQKSSNRSDMELVPFDQFFKNMTKSIVWPTDDEDEKNTFVKLLNIQDLFLQTKAPSELETIPNIKSASKTRRPQSIDPNEKLDADHKNQYENLDPFNMSEDEEAQKGQLSNIDRIAPPSFRVDPQQTFEQIPELKEMFNQPMEPNPNFKTSIQTGPDLRLISFNEKGERLPQPRFVTFDLNEQMNEQKSEKMIDVFALKVLGLLMCRGSSKLKGQLFLDLVIGNDDLAKGRDYVSINNTRLIRATKLLTFFAEIFPKKFMDEFDINISKAINVSGQKQHTKQSGKSKANTQDTSQNSNNKSSDHASQTQQKLNDLYWSKEYVMAAEELLQIDYEDYYSHYFVKELFRQNESSFTKKEFLKKMQGGSKSKSGWIFNPTVLRERFRENFDKDMDQATAQNKSEM